ncbi:MAG: GNAT family N-acetyltransferase [Alphaproteobacteria bacterium]|nr:GNAT family N-acetyltransferase [Alphaproteobacteria bacterium]
MGKDVEVMVATEADLEPLAEMHYLSGKLHRESCGMAARVCSNEEMFAVVQSIFNNPKSVLFKATCDNKICGCLFLWVFECEDALAWSKTLEIGHISEIFVHEKYRRQGIAKKMIETAEKYLKNRGVYALDLEVYHFNKVAQTFYVNQGFGPIKTYMHKDL